MESLQNACKRHLVTNSTEEERQYFVELCKQYNDVEIRDGVPVDLPREVPIRPWDDQDARDFRYLVKAIYWAVRGAEKTALMYLDLLAGYRYGAVVKDNDIVPWVDTIANLDDKHNR